MNILDAIVEHKRIEVLKRKQKRSLSDLKGFPHYRDPVVLPDLRNAEERPAIIAEFKRKSPSKGDIRPGADPVAVAGDYREAGAVAMSILTDRNFFGGSFRDLSSVRDAQPGFPLLRKDFIIDPYQVHEARAYGADIILLIAAILEKGEVADLAGQAQELGMEVLFEIHEPGELEKYDPAIRFVGVNNRDLRTFRIDTETGIRLLPRLPQGTIPVSESGINSAGEIRKLHRAGFRLFLMGEHFMRQNDPGEACRDFIKTL